VTSQRVQTTLSTAADALRGEELERLRVFIRLGWLVAFAVALAAVVLPGDPRIRAAFLGALGVTVLASVWVRRRLPDRVQYVHLLAFAAVVCGQLGILFVGAFSAAGILVGLGLYFFCRTESLALAVAVYLVAVLSHALEAGLVIAGVIDDPGFSPVRRGLSPLAQIAGQLTIQQSYGMAFWLARQTRKSSLRSIEQLQRTTRVAAQREVQLAELRQELDRALKIGEPGRFSGQVVGSWTLGNVLARGAMGEIYEGTHTRTGAESAVKMLRRELMGDHSHVERFYREVRIASAIESPHVTRVLEASTIEDPIPFLAMERLRGQTLGDMIRTGVLVGAQLRALVAQTASALELARQAGIVHRDLKPSNIFFTDDGTWKVLDFGIAVLGPSTGTLTGRTVIGTPTYMAPEQARGELVDHRADVYALGAVIYRCLTGNVLFVAGDTYSLLYAVVHRMPMRPSAIGTVNPDEEAVLAIALAKNKLERFATVAELAAAFDAASRGELAAELSNRAKRLLEALPWTEPEPVEVFT